MTDDLDQPERGKSQYWLDLIEEGQTALQDWQDAADNIDKAYADLKDLRSAVRDRDFQLFWSNIQIMGPAIYARPPVPVVTPKFKDRRALYRTASELLERTCVVSFDMADIDQTMIGLRDDLAIVGRGAAWVRYDSKDGDRVCYDHVDRKDFLHGPARKWSEVPWVARRAWLTKDEVKERFGSDVADDVEYQRQRDDNGATGDKAGVWELWHEAENKVVWVAEGVPETLEEAPPHLKLEGFFPCPRPAYATVQRRTLVPVPDMLLYKDQLEEVRDLTRRIHVLAGAIKVRGFYAGGGDVGEAIERAIKMVDDDQILIPIPAMQSLMQGGGDPIMWMPLEMVAQTITGLIELRRQVIDDVYQIVGLSDIMRGQTQADETYGAQRIKQQNGSARVRDKQTELVRVARDLARLGAEIMANEFPRDTLIDMAQMDLPTAAEAKRQLDGLRAGAKAEMAALFEKAKGMAAQSQQSGQQIDPQQAQQAAQQFEQAQQAIIGKWQPQIEQAGQVVTIDAVMEFLKDQKLRPFVLDIETDSTIYPDEMMEKQSRQEFMAAFAGTMQSLMPMMQLGPEAVAVAGGVFKFALAPYRVGRELEGLIDDFTDQGPAIAERLQAQASNGESDQLAQANMALAQAEMKKAEAAVAKVQADTQGKQQEIQLRAAEAQSKAEEGQRKFMLEVEQTKGTIAETEARIEKVYAEIQKLGVDAQNQTRQQDREDVKAVSDIQARQTDQALSMQDRERQAIEGERSNARADRQQQFTEQKTEQDRELQREAMKEKPNGRD